MNSVFGPLRRGSEPIAGEVSCDQWLEAFSDADGKFEFKNVLPDKYWQLACWDRPNVESHTVSGEQTSLAKPQNVTMTLDEAPAASA